MSLTLAELRKHATRVKHSRAQFIAASERLYRASAAPGSGTDRLERARRRYEAAQKEFRAAFNEGLGLLDAQAVRLVRQFKDESAALEQILEAEIARRGAQLRRQISKHLKT